MYVREACHYSSKPRKAVNRYGRRPEAFGATWVDTHSDLESRFQRISAVLQLCVRVVMNCRVTLLGIVGLRVTEASDLGKETRIGQDISRLQRCTVTL